MQVRFFVGEWVKRAEGYPETLATREEIMMTLADVNNILIKLQYNEGQLNTSISNIVMDSAAAPNSNLGPASYVEECECPVGYTGTSCEVHLMRQSRITYLFVVSFFSVALMVSSVRKRDHGSDNVTGYNQ
jgi:hypothetical protein